MKKANRGTVRKRTTKTVSASEARQQLAALLTRAHRKGTRTVIERSGIPIAAIVSADDLDRLQRFEEARSRDFEILDRVAERFADADPVSMQAEIEQVVADSRGKYRARSAKPRRTA